MGIYGHTWDDSIYNNSLHILQSTLEDNTNFINSLSINDYIVNESAGEALKGFINRIKEAIDKFIGFLKSIPGKIKDLISKIFSKEKQKQAEQKEEELKEKEKEAEKSSSSGDANSAEVFENKEYDKTLYNYNDMTGAMLNRSHFILGDLTSSNVKEYLNNETALMDEYEKIENDFGHSILVNGGSGKFHGIKTYDDFAKFINTDEYKDQFIIKNNKASDIKNNLDMYKNMNKNVGEIEEYANQLIKHWTKIRDIITEEMWNQTRYGIIGAKNVSTPDSYRGKYQAGNKVYDNVDHYRGNLAIFMKVINTSIKTYTTITNFCLGSLYSSSSQYHSVLSFLDSCYKVEK